jgi:general stress protein 26
MAQTEEVSRLLAGAKKTITGIRYCWLVTEAQNGGLNARPMGRLLTGAGENAWIVRFVTDGRSRKASDLRHAAEVGLIFQHADDAFVALIGEAILIENASEVRQLWKEAYSAYFRGEQDRANAAFVQVDVDRIELWVRGLTPEPFGLHPTTLERDEGVWRLTSGDREAA